MFSIFKKSLLALGFGFVSFAFVSARTVSECKTRLKEISQALLNKNVYNPKIASFVQESSILTEEETIEFCDQMLFYQKELGSKLSDVENIKEEIINYLRSFVASEMDLGEFDFNFAFIYNSQNPDFTVTFKNPAGEVKTRKYALKVQSIGLKFELVIKINGIMIIGSDFNYYDSANKEYELGSGLDLGWYPDSLESEEKWKREQPIRVALGKKAAQMGFELGAGRSPTQFESDRMFEGGIMHRQLEKAAERQREKWHFGVCLTFAKIKETKSMLVISGIAFGLGGSYTGTGIEASYVFGGKMTPVKE